MSGVGVLDGVGGEFAGDEIGVGVVGEMGLDEAADRAHLLHSSEEGLLPFSGAFAAVCGCGHVGSPRDQAGQGHCIYA
ncbi:hypothetical protein Skr01_74300 [Sphaerisporangium krabiense]|nr:hypothetical protein Skr01_74300 [Sphaerisporangium krabiense]